MIQHQLDQDESILMVTPTQPLSRTDFEALAAEVDPYIEATGGLKGLMIQAESFPGWEDFAALMSHFKFIRGHHRYIKRLAVVTDDHLVSLMPHLAQHFVAAEVRVFPKAERDDALQWLRDAPV